MRSEERSYVVNTHILLFSFYQHTKPRSTTLTISFPFGLTNFIRKLLAKRKVCHITHQKSQ
ncbi:hypothetical protein Hanom_Chr12g01148671 [Helianthus anomalus]